MHAHTHTHTHTCKQRHTYTHKHNAMEDSAALSLQYEQNQSYTHKHRYIHTHTHTQKHTHTHTHIHTHTRLETRLAHICMCQSCFQTSNTLPQPHSYASLLPSPSIILSHSYILPNNQSQRRPATGVALAGHSSHQLTANAVQSNASRQIGGQFQIISNTHSLLQFFSIAYACIFITGPDFSKHYTICTTTHTISRTPQTLCKIKHLKLYTNLSKTHFVTI